MDRVAQIIDQKLEMMAKFPSQTDHTALLQNSNRLNQTLQTQTNTSRTGQWKQTEWWLVVVKIERLDFNIQHEALPASI